MHVYDLEKHKERWRVLPGTLLSQAAVMVIPAGEKEGGPDNRHPNSDQWLLVLDGSGEARVEGRTVDLRRGTLLCVEAGERHQIEAKERLETINFYSPPQY